MRNPACSPLLSVAACAAACALSCGKTASPAPGQPGTQFAFDLDADLTRRENFFAFPWPSDLRLTASGAPDVTGFPNPRGLGMIDSFKAIALQRPGFPVVPAAHFVFSAKLKAIVGTQELPALPTAPVLLIDVDPQSPERGKLTPVVIATPAVDDTVPAGMLAVGPRPGFVLWPNRTYAFVVRRALGDATGVPLGVPATFDLIRQGQVPPGARSAAAAQLYAPLWSALGVAGIDTAEVAAATVFTTGDVVAQTAALSGAVLASTSVTIDSLALDAAGSSANDRVCELKGQIVFPQYQTGTPPFNTGGLFQFDANGLPIRQRDETVPITITIPRAAMPAAGYPLEVYFHGSGGASTDVIDMGYEPAGGTPTPGKGPGYVLAPFGVAAAGSALPVNPERLHDPNASDTAYLNLLNPAAMRDTFRQGIIEQRLYLAALRRLHIPPALLAGCAGPTLPASASDFFFDPDKLIAQGQSMGGMYTNLISAVEPRIKLAIPTGAGGYWTYFILVTHLLGDGVVGLLADILDTAPALTQLHPVLQLIESGWESADPFVSMPRLARRPLAGHPVRPIYEPVGVSDQYFPTQLYDAVALAYGHQEAGDVVWSTMQDALRLSGLDGILSYPVRNNRISSTGVPYTGAVIQYDGDHYLYRQNDSVKYQYGCFVSGWLKTGTPSIVAPQALGSPCP